jgi:hypothetical protein
MITSTLLRTETERGREEDTISRPTDMSVEKACPLALPRSTKLVCTLYGYASLELGMGEVKEYNPKPRQSHFTERIQDCLMSCET